jgi:hypothetical protein
MRNLSFIIEERRMQVCLMILRFQLAFTSFTSEVGAYGRTLLRET